MKIKVQIPRILSKSSAGELDLDVDGTSVGDLLDKVHRQEPELYRSICDETGRLRQHVNLFVNDDLLDRNKLDTRLESGDVVHVFQAVSGG